MKAITKILKTREMLLVVITIVSISISFFIGERLITGNFLLHTLKNNYWFYEIFFFISLSLAYAFIQSISQKRIYRIPAVLFVSYFTSFIGYHIYVIVNYSTDEWIRAFNDFPVLMVFAPTCLVGIVVSAVYAIIYEVCLSLAARDKY